MISIYLLYIIERSMQILVSWINVLIATSSKIWVEINGKSIDLSLDIPATDKLISFVEDIQFYMNNHKQVDLLFLDFSMQSL